MSKGESPSPAGVDHRISKDAIITSQSEWSGAVSQGTWRRWSLSIRRGRRAADRHKAISTVRASTPDQAHGRNVIEPEEMKEIEFIPKAKGATALQVRQDNKFST